MNNLIDFSKTENDDALRYSIDLGMITSEPVLVIDSGPSVALHWHPFLSPSLNSVCQMWSFPGSEETM